MKLDVDCISLNFAAAKLNDIKLCGDEFICFARNVIHGPDDELISFLKVSFEKVVTGIDTDAGSDFNSLIKDFIETKVSLHKEQIH